MKAAVIGSPISHSLSPYLHRAAYQDLGLEHTYSAIEVDQSSFLEFIATCNQEWLGLSLTMPLKEIAFSAVTEVSKTAKLTGSINTITFGSTAKGDNTDVFGVAQSLRLSGASNPKTATVIGAGATARSSIAALAGLGAQEVIVIARNPEKSASCIDLGNELGITLDTATTAIDILLSTDVVINTTPAGVADDFSNLLSVARGTLLEVIYNPWPTKLASAWQAKSLTVVPGYEMLLHQAVRQVELMTGQIPNVDVMRTAMLAELSVRGITPIS
jgi:shikimate dehydrogenase